MIKNARIIAVDVNPVDYHKPDPKALRGTNQFAVSSSSLRSFWYCPDKWRAPILNKDGSISYYEHAETEATRWGNMFDTYILAPKQFSQRYAVIPTTAPRKPTQAQRNAKKPSPDSIAAMEWWDDFEEQSKGKEIISDTEAFNLIQAGKRFLEYPDMKDFINGCDKQVWIAAEWFDAETGLVVPTKCLLDLLPNFDSEYAILDPMFPKLVADIKTTRNAHPTAWEKWAHTAGYEVQAAWNIDHVIAATEREIVAFAFLLSENHAPWQPAKRNMENDLTEEKTGDVNSGRRQYIKMMSDYCKCLKTGKWPGFDDTDEAFDGWTTVRPNPWAENARQFGPKFVFDEGEEQTDETAGDVVP